MLLMEQSVMPKKKKREERAKGPRSKVYQEALFLLWLSFSAMQM